MKKIKRIIVPAQPKHVVKKEVYVCDFCGKEGHVATCIICGRHICNGTFDKCTLYDPNEIGDYPDKYCPLCYDLRFVKYDKKIREIESEAETKIETIIQKVKKESLKHVTAH